MDVVDAGVAVDPEVQMTAPGGLGRPAGSVKDWLARPLPSATLMSGLRLKRSMQIPCHIIHTMSSSACFKPSRGDAGMRGQRKAGRGRVVTVARRTSRRHRRSGRRNCSVPLAARSVSSWTRQRRDCIPHQRGRRPAERLSGPVLGAHWHRLFRVSMTPDLVAGIR